MWIDYKRLPLHKNGDTLMFKTSVSNYSALPDSWQLYRRLLSEQPDHSVSICSIGFVSSLAQLLTSEGDNNTSKVSKDSVHHIYLI